MKFLKNLRIKDKLRIPIIFLLILLSVFFYFFLCTDSLIKSELGKKTVITDACKRIRTIYCTIMEYLNREKSYDQLNSDYQDLLLLVEKEGLIGDKEKVELIKLGDVFKRVDTIFIQNTRLEKQLVVLTDSYVRQFNGFIGEERDLLVGVSPGIIKSIYNVNWKVININGLFLKAKKQWDNGSTLMVSMAQTGKDIESEGQRLANTSFASLIPKAKDKVFKAKELAVNFIENTKAINQAKTTITKVYNGLLENIHQRETRNTTAIVAAIKNTFYAMGTVILVITLLIIVLYYTISKFITIPIRNIIDHTYDLAVDEMDMTKRLELDSKDEIGELSAWINIFLGRLHRLIKKMKNISDEVSSATEEITTGSEDLAARTNEQEIAITRISSTLEKIKEALRLTRTNSVEAAVMLANAESTQKGMKLVNDVSELFGQTIGVIREIEQKISYITLVSQEQSANVRQITQAIDRMDRVTNGNTSLAAQISSASRKVEENAVKLQNLVLQFKIDETPGPPPGEPEKLKKEISIIDARSIPSFITRRRKKKDKGKGVETILISEETTICTSTEDDFFGPTNDEGFEEF